MTRRRLLLLAVVLQVAWVGVHVRRGLGRWEADRILKAVESSTAQAVAAKRVAPAVLLRNVERLERAERLSPASAPIRLIKGSQYLLLGRYEPAIAAYESALRLEPRPEIHLNLGRALWRAGRKVEASENFARAVRLDPSLIHELPPGVAQTLLGAGAAEAALDGRQPGAPESDMGGE